MKTTQYDIHRIPVVSLVGGLLILTAVGSLVTGCAGSRRIGGSPLSAAVKEAEEGGRRHDDGERNERKRREREEHERDRPLRAGREVREPVVVDIEPRDRRSRHHRRERAAKSEPVGLSAGLSAGRSGYEDRSLERSRFLALEVRGSLPDACPRLELGGTLAGSIVDVKPNLSGGLRDVAAVSVGVSVRYYGAPQTGSACVYGIAGFDLGALHWDYFSPILIEDFGVLYEVDDDWVGTYSPYVGFGVDLFGTSQVQVGARLLCGYTFFDSHTHEGFYNDLFDPAPFARIQFDLSRRIR